ncbi:hypothetical protein THAOC_17526 [Thalassiosira oceanica]|uniref:Uncharacterized protein n=1 Tax=Thalassiosira oceanica TaxID=159749 RepID=K0SAB0_THAOC|nr:hypothetical protein THAOC_17526 [Thalassiosira oceanica]|eukprot:EJK61899.1 hypothetical protein THAOC_17526 [Thalassiosira oceanica]
MLKNIGNQNYKSLDSLISDFTKGKPDTDTNLQISQCELNKTTSYDSRSPRLVGVLAPIHAAPMWALQNIEQRCHMALKDQNNSGNRAGLRSVLYLKPNEESIGTWPVSSG